jgi:two-component system, sensor histidine kinase and response regulator
MAPSDALSAIANLDAAAGLSRVGGNKKLYLKLLRQFVEQQGQFVAHISEAQAKGDTPLAERLAHTLNGVAGNIGATQVRFAAGALEKCIRDGAPMTDVVAARQHVAASLDPLVVELQAALSRVTSDARTHDATPTAAAPLPESREVAARLTTLLSDLDPGAADFVETNQAALRPLFGDVAWPDFEKLVEGYAFADAQARLEQAVKMASKESLT